MYLLFIWYSLLYVIQTNKCTAYIYKQYCMYHKYSYMFRCICVIFREFYPSIMLKL